MLFQLSDDKPLMMDMSTYSIPIPTKKEAREVGDITNRLRKVICSTWISFHEVLWWTFLLFFPYSLKYSIIFKYWLGKLNRWVSFQYWNSIAIWSYNASDCLKNCNSLQCGILLQLFRTLLQDCTRPLTHITDSLYLTLPSLINRYIKFNIQ